MADAADGRTLQECVEGYLFSGLPPRLLILRRPPGRGGFWVPVSGKVEPTDASLEAALRRELAEEAGFADPVRVVPLDWVVEFDPPDGGRRMRLHGFGVETDGEKPPTLSSEHDAFEWVDPEVALARLHYPDNREAVRILLRAIGETGPPRARPGDPGSAARRGAPRAKVLPRFDEELFAAVRSAGHRKIALQVPAGLVRNAHDRAAELRAATGVPVVVVSRACFGACDFPAPEEVPGVDALVVLGHSPIPNVPLWATTYFVEMRYPPGDVERLAERIARAGLPKRVGLVASVQHLDLVAPLTRALAPRGISLVVGTGDRRLAYPAQALGCNYTGAEAIAGDVDAFLFLGTGTFHPIGLAFAVDRPVHAFDPLRGEMSAPIDRAKLIADRLRLVARTMDAKRFGILVSSFAGQERAGMASALIERARRQGREAEILIAARLDPRDLEGRDLDAYVNTACPRIALDDSSLYPRPVLTPPEFLMAIGEVPLTDYRFDTFH